MPDTRSAPSRLQDDTPNPFKSGPLERKGKLKRSSTAQLLPAHKRHSLEVSHLVAAWPSAAHVTASPDQQHVVLSCFLGRCHDQSPEFLGWCMGVPVTARLLQEGHDRQAASWEAGLLSRITHPNIVRFVGRGPQVLLTEHWNGSLETLLYGPSASPEALSFTMVKRRRSTRSVMGIGRLPSMHRLSGPSGSRSAPITHLPLQFVMAVGIQVARALTHLHPNVMHRNLKPRNIKLQVQVLSPAADSDPTGDAPKTQDLSSEMFKLEVSGSYQLPFTQDQVVKLNGVPLRVMLADFSLSATSASGMQDYPVGTLAYMAPECFMQDEPAKPVTYKCDIYAFGILMWELLHGRRPWSNTEATQVVQLVTRGLARPAFALPHSQCPSQLALLIQRCWAPDPKDRPTATAILTELLPLRDALQICSGPASQQWNNRVARAMAMAPVAADPSMRLSQFGVPELGDDCSLLSQASQAANAPPTRAADQERLTLRDVDSDLFVGLSPSFMSTIRLL